MPRKPAIRYTRRVRNYSLIALLLAVACGGVDDGVAEDVDDVRPARHTFTLQNAPVAGRYPTALVHFGRGFDPDGGLNLVVYFHGWNNCIVNTVESSAGRCSSRGAVRTAHKLIEQLDASGANAALVAVQRTFDQPNSSAGRLAERGFFRAMILELLPKIGALAGRTYTEADLGSIVLAEHSGGYVSVARILEVGGLTDRVSQVILLDGLYGDVGTFESWVKGDVGNRRLAVVYSDHGGTRANSQALASRLKTWLAAQRLDPKLLTDDRTTATLAPAAYEVPILIKRSGLSHDGVAQYYFRHTVAGAGL